MGWNQTWKPRAEGGFLGSSGVLDGFSGTFSETTGKEEGPEKN
jgi:hypothetical protein